MCPRQKWRSVNRLIAWCTKRSFAAAGLALLMVMILWAGCGKPAAEKRLWREFVMDLKDIRRIADCSSPIRFCCLRTIEPEATMILIISPLPAKTDGSCWQTWKAQAVYGDFGLLE